MFNKQAKRPPEKDNPCCDHTTSQCQRYEWWIKQQGKTVRITQGAHAGAIGRLNGFNFAAGEVVYQAGCQLHEATRTIYVAYADLEVVDGSSKPTPCCECCCGHCDHCGHGLMGGECVAECRKAKSHPDPLTVEARAAWLTKVVFYATAYGSSREEAAKRVQQYLEEHFHQNGECPPEMCRKPFHCEHCGDCC